MELSGYALEPLRKDEEFVLYRGHSKQAAAVSVLVLAPVSLRPVLETLKKMEHEYSFRNELDARWAVRPITLSQYKEQRVLVLEDTGGEPLNRIIHGPMEMKQFLRFAIGLATALSELHKRALIHKDVKPANVVVDSAIGQVWLMGFGITSRLPRERQSPEPPEFIAGTLPYMAPEQTGRMNRSIDSRSDLYALGVTLYEMLTGSLPFTASDSMELVHCHIARQPVPPHERLESVPGPVSGIIMKLLAKTPEERYQTAAGVESDLRRCLAQWETQHRIDEFPLAEHDTPDRMLIPEKLYGRGIEIQTLLNAFDRIVAGSRPELVLVSGYSGIGKSSVVNELHKPLVPPRGLFASGKFDQYKRDIPYATLAQAFQSLLRPLLTRSEAELSTWRAALREALDPNGQLIVDLVPELKLIIGEQPPVPELSPQDAQGRFQLVFRRFISVFARAEHPLALFLDDLQWLDAATLDLMEDLLTRPDMQHLMLIGAYRDNEVNSSHPLIRKLETMRQAGAILKDIVLAPLTREDMAQLIADSLHCDPERASPLAQLIHYKTGGNPFFAIQFISELAEEALLTFDHGEGRWSWDLTRIHAKGYTDNVVDLMVGKLSRLPVETQKALQQLACLGNSAEFAMLLVVYQESEEEMHCQLWEAVRAGLICRSAHSYRFLHDRVQEAAYCLIPQELRAEAHLRIGRLLVAHTPPEKLEDGIFEIVNQLNRGSHLIASAEDRKRVAELNFIAGRRAKTSTAYASALKYLTAGRALLTQESWEDNYELIFSIECLIAECELLTADMVAAEDRLSMLAQHAKISHDIAVVTRLRLMLYTTLDRSDRGVEVCLEYLRRGGTDWSPHPTHDEVLREYDRIWSLLGNRQIEELIDLPLITNPDLLDTLDVLTELVAPALFTDENLLSVVICRMVNLSLQYGNGDGSCFAYVWFAIIAGPRFSNYGAGARFGLLGYDLVEKRGLKRFQARTYMCYGNIVLPWTSHVKTGRDLVRRAFDTAYRVGDLTFAAYSRNHLITNFLAAGDSLAEVQREAENGLEFAQSVGFGLVIDQITTQLGLIRTLRGLTQKFGCFDHDGFNERLFEDHLSTEPGVEVKWRWYSIRKLQARFFAGEYASAVAAASMAQRMLWTSPSQFETAEFHFYGALSHAASWDSAFPGEKQRHFEALADHHRQLEIWAENCPQNFENRAALVGAEIARIEGREYEAMRLYEQAIRSARASGFVHNEALGYEIAGRFYAAHGFDKIANAYLREAQYGYLRWGADGKVKQLDKLYPHLNKEGSPPGPTSTIVAPVERLDLATVIKVSQAVSGEMVLEKLVDKLMRMAIEHAGAERGLLIVPRGVEERIDAEATTSGDKIIVHLRNAPVTAAVLPESVARYVMRTHESVILDDASSPNPFSADPFIVQHRTRSVLCLPLIDQARLTGVLYLENNLASHVFSPNRIAVLKVIASQAAVSLENTRLYRDLENREAKIRRLIDANVMGIFIWNLEGAIVGANEAFLQMVQCGREDLLTGRMRWTDLTPAEWRERDKRAQAEMQAAATVQPYEKEFFRKDGSRVPVLAGAALFEEGGDEGVAFVLDLTEQKRAEEALRRSESYLAEAQRLSHTGSFGWDVSDGEIYWSAETFRIFEYPPTSKVTIEMVLQRTHPEDRLAVQQLIERVSRERTEWDFEHRLLMPDGSIKYLQVVGRPSFEEGGHFEFVGAVTDVSERKRADAAVRQTGQELAAQGAHLHELFEQAPEGIVLLDVEDRVLRINREFIRMFGYVPDEAIGRRINDLIAPGELRREADEYTHQVTERGETLNVETVRTRKDGSHFPVSIIGVPVSIAGSQIAEYAIYRDITERKRAEEERERLRQTQSDLAHINRVSTMGELTASLAHEIKQPISAAVTNAKTCLRWLGRNQPDVAEAQEAASRFIKDVTRASDIISRIGSLFKKEVLRQELVDVNELIGEMVVLLRSEAARHSISMHDDLASNLPQVMADRVQLQQVFMNLMLNGIEAMKHMGTPGKLTIKSQQVEDRKILVSVTDTGVGLNPKQAEQIFNAFFTTKSQGTGMGLPISRSIIESHGGHLWATTHSGPGATFQFTLPIEVTAREAA